MGKTKKTAKQVQQELAEVYGSRDIIPWDLYTKKQKQYLIDKIKLLMPDVTCYEEEDERKRERQNNESEEIRSSLVNALWNQRKYYGGDLLMSIIYVLWTETVEPAANAKWSTEYTMYPVFRVRKCYVGDDSTDCCMIFVDVNSRVYKNWQNYKDNNTLPEGIIVAPRNGIYNFDENDEVYLECFETPASGIEHKVGIAANVLAAVGGLGSAAVIAASVLFPIGAPIVAGSALVGIGSSIWSTGSSVSRLVDRGKHEQAIGLTNAQARAEWFGIAGGVIGLGAAGASGVLAKAASGGRRVSSVVRGTVGGINLTSIAVNGIDAGNSACDVILKVIKDEEISLTDAAQFGVSLFLITHSVYNFRTAVKIMRLDNYIYSERSMLSNRQRKAFDKAYQETIRLRGDERGRMDVIRALDNMPDSKQPLNDLYKIKSKLGKQNVKVSLHPDGHVVVNNNVVIDARELRVRMHANVSLPNGPAPAPSAPANSWFSTQNFFKGLEFVEKSRKFVASTTKLTECFGNILKCVTPEELEKLCSIASDFLEDDGREITTFVRRFVSYEEVLWKTFELIVEICDGKVEIGEWIAKASGKLILDMLKKYYYSLKPKLGQRINCDVCRGYYTLKEC